jgi:hypothetical protein
VSTAIPVCVETCARTSLRVTHAIARSHHCLCVSALPPRMSHARCAFLATPIMQQACANNAKPCRVTHVCACPPFRDRSDASGLLAPWRIATIASCATVLLPTPLPSRWFGRSGEACASPSSRAKAPSPRPPSARWHAWAGEFCGSRPTLPLAPCCAAPSWSSDGE